MVPNNHGDAIDIVLGFDEGKEYAKPNGPFFGSTVGRFANRIGGAAFTIDHVKVDVSANEPPNCLHGGRIGWSHKLWKG